MTNLKPVKYFQQATELPQPEETLQEARYFSEENRIPEETLAPAENTETGYWRRYLWYLALLSVVLLAGWQWLETILQGWQQNSVKGFLYSLASFAVLALLFAWLWQEWLLWQRLRRNEQWQLSVVRIQHNVQFGEALPLCQNIVKALPASDELDSSVRQWQQAVTAQHSDQEVLQLFDKLVLVHLDKEAQASIRRAATDTSLAVAISPFALADMLLVLWRSSRMLRELTQLYGGSIGQLRSLLMLKRLLGALFWAGSSELALDMATDVFSSELTGKLSMRAGQGMIAGLLVARVGTLVQQQLRPLPSTEKSRVSIKQLAKGLFNRLSGTAISG